MLTEGPGGHRGPSAPSQAASRKVRAGLGPGKAAGPQSCRETKRSSKSREEDEIPNLKDLPWTTSCRRGLTPAKGTHGYGNLGTISIWEKGRRAGNRQSLTSV